MGPTLNDENTPPHANLFLDLSFHRFLFKVFSSVNIYFLCFFSDIGSLVFYDFNFEILSKIHFFKCPSSAFVTLRVDFVKSPNIAGSVLKNKRIQRLTGNPRISHNP